MKRPSLIALDLDGTLLPASKEITPHARSVLHAMRELGTRVTLATGKFHHLAQRYGRELELDVAQISHDGAWVGTPEGEVSQRCMPQATVRELLDRFQDRAAYAFADDGQDTMLLREPDAAFKDATRNWATRFGHVEDLRGHLQGDPAILTFYGDEQDMQEVLETGRNEYPMLRVSRYWSEYLHLRRITFQPAGVSKGSGVVDLANSLGIEAQDCMVFGDWHNDRPMFEVGATGVAMNNAVPEVKALADHVTQRDCENDGVAHFLEQNFL